MYVGNPDSRLAVYLAHRPALLRLATAIVGCRARAEDVVQESFLRFLSDADATEPLRHPAAYLQRIVRNLAFDSVRKRSAECRGQAACAQLCQAHPLSPSPEDLCMSRDDLRQARAAIAEMPERQRQAFLLHRLYGMTYQEIGAHLEVSTATAHRLTRDALVRIMNQIEAPS